MSTKWAVLVLLSLVLGGWNLYSPVLQHQYETEFNRHEDAYNKEEWDKKVRVQHESARGSYPGNALRRVSEPMDVGSDTSR